MQSLARRKTWPAATSPRLLAPVLPDYQLSDFCQKLYAGAIAGHQYAPAWSTLVGMFRATGAQLVRDVPSPVHAALESGPIRRADHRTPHPAVAESLAPDEHAVVAVCRIVPRGFDALVLRRHGDPFTEDDCTWLEMLLPHLAAALDLGDQLAQPLPTAASAAQLARLLPTPCVLADGAGRCVERNHALNSVLEKLSGQVRGGRVVFDDPMLHDEWRQALMEGSLTAATQSILATTSEGERWKLHVVPFYCVSSAVHGKPQHLMFALFERLVRADSTRRPLAALRPLTKAELEVLAQLQLGHTAKAIARGRNASVNTVRNQIGTILGKTGHRTQKELMASFSAGALFEHDSR